MLSNRSIGISKMSLHTYPTSPKGPCVRCAILRCSNCTAQLVDCTLKSSRSWMLFRGTYSYFHGCLKKKLHLTREARVLLYTFSSVSQSLLKTEAQGSFGQQFRAQRMHQPTQWHFSSTFVLISACPFLYALEALSRTSPHDITKKAEECLCEVMTRSLHKLFHYACGQSSAWGKLGLLTDDRLFFMTHLSPSSIKINI